MSAKVLETWINETLQDAEHLDIPGVVLKPEHKNPISRYGIDRIAFSNTCTFGFNFWIVFAKCSVLTVTA